MDDGLSDLADLSRLASWLAHGLVVHLPESSTGKISVWMHSILVSLSMYVTPPA